MLEHVCQKVLPSYNFFLSCFLNLVGFAHRRNVTAVEM